MSSELIVDGSIIADKMAANSITAANGAIANLAVTTAKIDDFAVTNGKIDNLAITNAKVSDLSASKLTAGTINAATITVTNLNASNLTVGTINGSRYGDDSIDGRPIVPGSLHSTMKSAVSSVYFPFQGAGKFNIDLSSASTFNLILPSNPYRTAVLLIMRVDIEWPTAGTGYYVYGITRVVSGVTTILGDCVNWWTSQLQLYHNSVFSLLDTNPGTASINYVPRHHHTNPSAQFPIDAYAKMQIIEFSK
jgi:hypothetical protein